jgi:ComF family protein
MSLTRTTSLLYDGLLALMYPQSCAVCNGSVELRTLGIACASCWNATRTFTCDDTICWKCGALSKGTIAREKREEVRCRRCDQDAFTAARACGVYEGALRASVLALKRNPELSGRVVDLLKQTQSLPPLDAATRIIPVPLHPRREKSRGFNQAALIARALSKLARVPSDEISLIRTSHSERHRAGMDAKGRRETVAQAFSVRYPRLVAEEKVLLVDDVFTTGATVSACAAALIAAGAEEVFVLTLARPLYY